MSLCPHCMQQAQGAYCTNCGGDLRWENPAHLLGVGARLTGGGLGHSYRIGACLGQGGFGVTYVALEEESGRRVAIKEYFPTRCACRGAGGTVDPLLGQEAVYEGGRYSFVQEARMLAALEGMPSVVQGLDYLEVNNTAYLVMEYLDGTPLYRMVNDRGRIAALELMPRLYPLLRDMGRLHAVGVIHRDISPDNVMWMKDGTLKLLDFGCARSMEDGKSMTVALKQGFAPVEQYRTHGQGPWTDVYALSATVYYCLTGKVPPAAPERLMEDTLVAPNALGAGLTAEEEGALLWGMTIDPKLRPANMELFAQRMFPQRYAAGTASNIPPVNNAPPAFHTGTAPDGGGPVPVKRGLNPKVLIGIAAAALIVIGIAAYFISRGSAERPGSGSLPADPAVRVTQTFNNPVPTARPTPKPTPEPTPEPTGAAALFPLGMMIGPDGTDELVELYTAEDGAVYGITEWDDVVLLRVPDGVDSYSVPEKVGPYTNYVNWIEKGALDNARPGITMNLGIVTRFDFSLYEQAQWVPHDWVGSFSLSWLLSCRAAHEINALRGGGPPTIEPNYWAMFAADDRVQELTELYDGETRPDGSTDIFAPLDDWGYSYDRAKACWVGEYASYDQLEAEIMRYVPGWAAPADEDTGEYWDALGIAVAKSDEGEFYFWCYAAY